MAVPGAKPKPEGRKVTGHPLTQEWTDVQDVPYRGDKPTPPGRLAGRSKRWWEVVSSMPHCVLWSESDWEFALDTLAIHRRFSRTGEGAAELRIREKLLGTTMDARRDLRIRYIPLPEASAEDEGPKPTNFAAARRSRIMGQEGTE